MTAALTTTGPPAGPTTGPTTGTRPLLRLVLRLDRFRIAIWALAIGALVEVSAVSILGLYDTRRELLQYAALVRDNAAMIIQAGPGYGLAEPSVGNVMINETSTWTLIAIALMSIFLVTRHTRAEEDSERVDLVRGAVVGRRAPAIAALVGTIVASALVALAVGLALIINGFPTAGSLAFAASLLACGSVFAALTLLVAQLAPSSRATNTFGVAAVAVAFVVRAVGDVGDGRISWLSPIGWSQAVRPFADERWAAFAVPAVATGLLTAAALAAVERRDVAASLIRQRPGPATGPAGLRSPFALAIRLHRASIGGWVVGVGLMGFFYGFLADQAEKMLEDNPDLAKFLTQLGSASLTDAFLSTAVLMMGLLAAGAAVTAASRLHTEEDGGRTELLAAGPVARRTWAGAHLAVSGVTAAAVLLAGGLGTGLGVAVATGQYDRIGELTWAVAATAPAVAVLAALTFTAAAARPRWTAVGWAALASSVVIALFAGALDLPYWVRDLSPFQHVSALPAGPFRLAPSIVLTVVAVGVALAGFVGLARRDLTSG